jgi:hypothetical protein
MDLLGAVVVDCSPRRAEHGMCRVRCASRFPGTNYCALVTVWAKSRWCDRGKTHSRRSQSLPVEIRYLSRRTETRRLAVLLLIVSR